MNWYMAIGLSIICLVTIFGIPPLARYFILFGNEKNHQNRKEYQRTLARATVVMMILYAIGILAASVRG